MAKPTIALACLAALGLLAAFVPASWAHASYTVGTTYKGEILWNTEPPVVDQGNQVVITVKDAQSNPVSDLTIVASLVYGAKRMDLDLAEDDETPGSYVASVLPTEEGKFKIQITKIGSTTTDVTRDLDAVVGSSAVAFPEANESQAELQGRVDLLQLITFISLGALAVVLVLSVLGLVVATRALGRARKGLEAARQATTAPASRPLVHPSPAPAPPRTPPRK